MTLKVGQKGYHIYRGYVEEFEVQEVKLEEYKVKSSYYTYSVGKEEVYATHEEANKVLAEDNAKILQNYRDQMASKEDFIEYCIEKALFYAKDPDNYDRQLERALKEKYKEHFGKEIT